MRYTLIAAGRKHLAQICLILAALVCLVNPCAGQTLLSTNNVLFNLNTFGLQPRTVTSVTVQPQYWAVVPGTYYLNPPQSASIVTYPTLTNGSVVFSNQVCGVPWRVTFSGYYGSYSTNYLVPATGFITNNAGQIDTSLYVGIYASPTAFYYSFLNGFNFATNFYNFTNFVSVTNIFNLTNNIQGTNYTIITNTVPTNAASITLNQTFYYSTNANFDVFGQATTVGANGTNNTLIVSNLLAGIAGTVGSNGTNNTLIVSNLLAGIAGTIGSNGTNNTVVVSNLLAGIAGTIGSNGTNNTLIVSNLLAGISGTIGSNGTNNTLIVSNLLAGIAGTVGSNGTNNTLIVSNLLAAISGTIGSNGTNNTLIVSNLLAAASTVRTLSISNQTAYLQAQIVCDTNYIILTGGTSSYANANGTDVWQTATSWTNINGLSWITNDVNGSRIVVSGTTVLGASGGWPVGSAYTNISGSGTIPTAVFPVLQFVAGANMTVSKTGPGVWTFTSTGGGGGNATNIFFGSTNTVANIVLAGTNYFYVPTGTFDAFNAALNATNGAYPALLLSISNTNNAATNAAYAALLLSISSTNTANLITDTNLANAATNAAYPALLLSISNTNNASTNAAYSALLLSISSTNNASTNAAYAALLLSVSNTNNAGTNAAYSALLLSISSTNNAGTNAAYAALLTSVANTNALTSAVDTAGNISSSNRVSYLAAQQGCNTNYLIVTGGTSSYANANGTDVWQTATSWTNQTGLSWITNDSAGSRIYVSGTAVAGSLGGWPAGTVWTNITGSGTLPTTAFVPAQLVGAGTVTVAQTSPGVWTITGSSLGTATNVFFSSSANVTWSLTGVTNVFTVPASTFDAFGQATTVGSNGTNNSVYVSNNIATVQNAQFSLAITNGSSGVVITNLHNYADASGQIYAGSGGFINYSDSMGHESGPGQPGWKILAGGASTSYLDVLTNGFTFSGGPISGNGAGLTGIPSTAITGTSFVTNLYIAGAPIHLNSTNMIRVWAAGSTAANANYNNVVNAFFWTNAASGYYITNNLSNGKMTLLTQPGNPLYNWNFSSMNGIAPVATTTVNGANPAPSVSWGVLDDYNANGVLVSNLTTLGGGVINGTINNGTFTGPQNFSGATVYGLFFTNAATTYVDPNGSYNGQRGLITKPFALLSQAVSNSIAGDTIIITAGQYNEGVNSIKLLTNMSVIFNAGAVIIGTNAGNASPTISLADNVVLINPSVILYPDTNAPNWYGSPIGQGITSSTNVIVYNGFFKGISDSYYANTAASTVNFTEVTFYNTLFYSGFDTMNSQNSDSNSITCFGCTYEMTNWYGGSAVWSGTFRHRAINMASHGGTIDVYNSKIINYDDGTNNVNQGDSRYINISPAAAGNGDTNCYILVNGLTIFDHRTNTASLDVFNNTTNIASIKLVNVVRLDGTALLISNNTPNTVSFLLLQAGNVLANYINTSVTNIVTFSSVSLATNTLGYDGTALVSSGTTVLVKTPSGVTAGTVGTVGSVDEVIPLRAGWYLSGTTMSGVIY